MYNYTPCHWIMHFFDRIMNKKNIYSMENHDRHSTGENGEGVEITQTNTMSRNRIIKNLLIVSSGFLLNFTAYGGLANLQSTLNKEDGLGVGGLATTYGALVISCLFLAPLIIGRLGCKWAIAVSMSLYILYMLANFHAIWGTIIPGAIFVGLGAAPLWSAKCTYLTQSAVWYAEQTKQTQVAIINRFFGVFFMIFQSSKLSLRLMLLSYFILYMYLKFVS